MVEKTLSTGTLNLRFMQNARRVQQLPQLEPDQAHVRDDAEWEVPSQVRDAWGPSAYRAEKAVTYETSYLPFLFPSLHDTPAAHGPSSLSPPNALPPRGRRVFGKPGQQITLHPSNSTAAAAPPHQEAVEHTRPHSISSARQPKKSNKSAKAVIFDTSGLGTDLGRSSSFLRPAGVDAPAEKPPETLLLTGAAIPPHPGAKRSRTSGEADKPKKKSRLALIE